MSKSLKSRLTGSGRKPRRPVVAGPAGPDWLDCMDGLDDCCEVIETVAGLLLACGDDELDGKIVRTTGGLIEEQIRQLKAWLEKLEAAR